MTDPSLKTAAAVRARCTALLHLAETTGLPHFTVHPDRLPETADFVAGVIRQNYPTLEIPHHARWRHFAAGGIDRWAQLRATLPDQSPAAIARTRVALCITSTLLDAGAGPAWSYTEPSTGLVFARSEGLGVASFDAFRSGLFSHDGTPHVDAVTLAALQPGALARAFQSRPGHPLLAVEGRAALLRRLGTTIAADPARFPNGLGGLYDTTCRPTAPIPALIEATNILETLLAALTPIWPRPDIWPHPSIPGDGLVPFHKLSQWLAYSLIEVFEDAGHPVTGIDALTGLPEYRNGGLFIDCGVLTLNDPALATTPLPPGHPAIVEWRALTVALLDRLAPLIRTRLHRDAQALPLSRILEGGTWAAGRAIAAKLRPGGGPPMQIDSDGTVF